MITVLIPAISLGFLGSFHCIGMCGPIALSLPIQSPSLFGQLSHLFLYNLGRTITYSFFGAIFGFLGQTFYLFGVQQYFSIAVGTLLLLYLFFSSRFSLRFKFSAIIYSKLNVLKNSLAKQLQKKGLVSVLSIGILNGLLPCGLVYMAMVGALTAGSVLKGMVFMLAFGLATIPIMLSLSLLGNILSISFKNTIRKITPFVIGVMALLLILRGLNLNIPYVSPKINQTTSPNQTIEINCHK